MANLSLSKFKKLESDKNCTTLVHKDGHELRIAHKSLSDKMKKDLDAIPMASGGEVDREHYEKGVHHTAADKGNSHAGAMTRASAKHPGVTAGQAPKNIHKRVLSDLKAMPKPKLEGLSKGGGVGPHKDSGVHRAADKKDPGTSTMGTYVRSSKEEPGNRHLAKESAQRTLREMDRGPKPKLLGLAEGGGPEDAEEIPQEAQAPATPAININLTGHPQGQAEPAPQDPAAAPSEPPPQQMQAPVAQQPAMASSEEISPDPTAPPTPEQHAQQAKNYFQTENQLFDQDLAAGHIKPQTYKDLYAKKDTLGKIGTFFGLLLSGAGAGLSHQPNALLGMMDKEIQRDLDAQEKSSANAQNLLRLNQQRLAQDGQLRKLGIDSDTAAYALTQAQTMQTTYHDLVQKVNAMPPGPQKEMANQQLATVYSKIGEKINNINDQAAGASAYQKMLFGGSGGGGGGSSESAFQKTTNGMRMLGNPQADARAKDMEEKHFPGLRGQASLPLSGSDRESINSGMDFDQKINRFKDWTKKHSGDLNPSERFKGQALAAELQGAYRQAIHGGVYKEGEQNFISKLIDSEPTKFFNSIRVLPQLEAISGENKSRLNQLVKSKGFEGYDGASAAPSGHSSAPAASGTKEGQTMTTKSGMPIVFKNGAWRHK